MPGDPARQAASDRVSPYGEVTADQRLGQGANLERLATLVSDPERCGRCVREGRGCGVISASTSSMSSDDETSWTAWQSAFRRTVRACSAALRLSIRDRDAAGTRNCGSPPFRRMGRSGFVTGLRLRELSASRAPS
jgi:hypothetical protein